LLVATINVTSLTKPKLETTFNTPQAKAADVICFQEVKFATPHVPPWVRKLAGSFGFRATCSFPPEVRLNGTPGYRGTLVLWKRTLGKVSTDRWEHRMCAIKSARFTVVSAYGPASRPDPIWFDDLLARSYHLAGSTPLIVVGDLNWRRMYADALVTPLASGKCSCNYTQRHGSHKVHHPQRNSYTPGENLPSWYPLPQAGLLRPIK
jgi:exonuclease III